MAWAWLAGWLAVGASRMDGLRRSSTCEDGYTSSCTVLQRERTQAVRAVYCEDQMLCVQIIHVCLLAFPLLTALTVCKFRSGLKAAPLLTASRCRH